MINYFITPLKLQEQLLYSSWKLNQHILNGYTVMLEDPDNSLDQKIADKQKQTNRRQEDWQRHILPYRHKTLYRGGSLTDHYGKRSCDVDVERL